MKDHATLAALPLGRTCVVTAVEGALAQRLRALGFVSGARVGAELESAGGDPVAYRVCGALIALRRKDAGSIAVDIED